MRKYRIRDGYNTRGSRAATDISVLVRISDAHSDSLVSFQLLVNPWPLFASDELALSGEWLLQGQSNETVDEGTRRRKRRKKGTPLSASWASSLLASPLEQHRRSNQPNASGCDSARQVYKYKPLEPGFIRLLYLLPGENMDQDLQGVVVQVSHNLDCYGPGDTYWALSYVWGVDERTEELVTPDGIIRITSSLSAALRHLRQRTTPLTLWIDAVCINQSDNTEKVQQIRLLPTIFQNAEFTYAFWAGSGTESADDAAIEMLTQVQAQVRLQELKTEWDLGSDSEASEEDWALEELELTVRIPPSWGNKSIPPPEYPVWNHLEALFSRPWFQRAWILQEVVASADLRVVCGNSLVDWGQLQIAVEIVYCEAQASEHETMIRIRDKLEPFMAIAMQREWEARQHRWALISLLERFRHLASTLRRDRFFALLGLSSDANEPEFAPDYSSPLEVIVLRFARVFVRQGRGMQLLYRAGLNAHSHRFPSWVPDWTQPKPDCLHESDQRSVPFDASKSQEEQIRASADTDELRVGGYAVDVVERVSAASNTEGEWREYLAEVDAMVDQASLAVVSDDRECLKWKVPVAGVEHPKFITPGSLDLRPSYEALKKLLDLDVNTSAGRGPLAAYTANLAGLAADALRMQSASYTSVLRDTAVGWRFVVTANGYVGVAPGLVKAGDAIAVLKGGLVPFVVCKSEQRQGAFRLVGECYVHGLMHGEGLALDDVTEREFCLH